MSEYISLVTDVGTVTPKPVEWLWHDRIPIGALTLMSGDPGIGKSFISLDMAARVANGLAWPDGTICPSGKVLLISCEDDVERTISRRLRDIEGVIPRDRIFHCDSIEVDGKELPITLSLEEEYGVISQLVRQIEPRLIVIDPISAFMGKGVSGNNDPEVRTILRPLSTLAEELRSAVVVIGHLNKRSGSERNLHRASGSIGFAAAARVAWFVERGEQDNEWRWCSCIKNNWGHDDWYLSYRIKQTDDIGTTIVEWRCDVSEEDYLEAMTATKEDDTRDDRRQEIDAWLQRRLGSIKVHSKELFEEARELGYTESAVRKSKDRLKVEHVKDGAIWYWLLPASRVMPD